MLTSTAIDETLLEIALAKLGLTPLLLSINNSVHAVVHLCRQTQSSHLIYGTKYEAVARETKENLAREGVELEILAERRFPLWGKGGIAEAKVEPYSGFPKPVYVTHYGLIANAAQSIPKTGFSALPVFHGFGHFSM